MEGRHVTTKDLENLYNEHFDRIYKFFYYKVIAKDIAEDLTSETFLTLAEILKDNKNIENPKAFLYGVAKNIFLKFLQKKYKQEIPLASLGEDFEEYIAATVEEVEKKETLEDKLLLYIGQIPEKQQIVLRLRFIEKLGLKEICEKLGKDMNYVKTTQKRGLKSLKELVATNNLGVS